MITVKTGNYTEKEIEMIPKFAWLLQYHICIKCDNVNTCSEFANRDCTYRHILNDLLLVQTSFPSKPEVTKP